MWPALPMDQHLNKLVPPASTCTEQSTRWSACSRSCGSGVSTRVSNQNPACKLQMETRLCKVRPCHAAQHVSREPMVSFLLIGPFPTKEIPPKPVRFDPLTVWMCRFSQWGLQRRCKASYASPGPIRLVHQDCHSTRAYQLRYCGRCSDARCCTPHHTTTAEVTFRCPAGRRLQRAVMMIQSCVCHNNCPYAPHSNPALWGYRP